MSGPLKNPRDHRRLSNFTVGVIAALLIVFLSYLSATKRLPFTDGGFEVEAVFSSVNNELAPRSPVRIAGVEVGTVTAVEEGPGNTALVTMEIDDDGLPIHADATARIRPRLFLEGNYFVELTPGSPSAPDLEEGGQLPVTQTANSVRLDEVVDVLDANTRTSLKRLAKGLSGGLAKGGAESFNSSLDAWQGAFKGLATTMEDLRGTEIHDLSEFVDSQALVSQALADRDQALADLIVEFRRTTGALASRPGKVSATIREAARTASTARPALAELSAALPSLRRFAIGVRPALREAPPALDDALPFLDQVDKLVKPRALRGLVSALRPVLPGALRLEPRLGLLFDQVEPVASCVSDNVLPVITSAVPDEELSTGQPAWQELLRGGGGLAGSSASFDANGPYIRLYAGAGESSFTTQLPGVGDLVGPTELPVVGARPADPADAYPPHRPDVECATQPVQELAAQTTFYGPAQNRAAPSGAEAPPFDELLDASTKLYEAGSTRRLADRLSGRLAQVAAGATGSGEEGP